MADNNQVKKIYDISLLGGDEALGKLVNLNKEFTKIKKTVVDLKATKATIVDKTELDKSKQALIDAQTQLQKTKIAQAEARNEAIAYTTAQKQLQLENKKTVDGNKFVQGSYYDIAKQVKQLKADLKGKLKLDLLDETQIKAATADIRVLEDRLRSFNRSISSEGTNVGEYTRGIINAFKQAGLDDLIKSQVDKSKQKLGELNKEFNSLQQELSEIKVTGQGSFESVEKKLIENRQEAQKLQGQLAQVQNEMKGFGSVGGQITESLNKNFSSLKSNIAQMVFGFIGFQAAFGKITQAVQGTKEISDTVTELEVNMGLATGGANELVNALKQIDTRTTLQGLLEISDVALKAGVSNENLQGVTEAIDKVKVAFGKDFGSVEQGTETFAKLINIFYTDGQITGDRILKIGNSIRTLANETTASVPYLTDFAGRMAGVKQIANVSLSDIIGLGAGFEQFKQSAEVSSTALVKIIPKLATDIDKFAKVTGLTKKQFKELLENNPAEALIKVSEALVKSGKGITDVSAAFADSELGSGRIATILATLGGKANVFREQIKKAGGAMQDGSSITDAFGKKNTNLASVLDKISKKFADLAGSKGFQITIEALGSAIVFLIKSIPTLITLGSILLAGWIAQNTALFLLNARVILYTIAQRGLQITYGLLAALQAAYTIGLGLLTGAYTIATGAAALFSRVIKATPLGIVLTIVGLLGAAFTALGHSITGTTNSLKQKAIQDKINAEIDKRVIEQTSEQITKVKDLTAVVKDNTASLDVRKRALEELKAIGGEYLKGLTLENAATAEGTKLLNDYIESLKLKAAYEAVSAIQSEKIKEDLKLGLIESKLQKRVSTKKDTGIDELTPEEKEFVGTARKQFAFTASVTDLFTGGSAADEALAVIQQKRGQLAIEIDETSNLVKEKYKALGITIIGGPIIPPPFKPSDDKKGKKDKSTDKEKSATELLKEKYDSEKKILDTQFNDKELTEEHYNILLLEKANDFRDKKLALLKAKDAEEQKQQIDFNNDLSKDQYEALKKQYDIKLKALEQEKSLANKAAQIEFNKVDDNPQSTDLQKAKAKQKLLDEELQIELDYSSKLKNLENTYNQKSVDLEKQTADKIEEIKRQRFKNEYDIALKGYQEQQKLADEAATRQKNEAETNAAQQTINVLSNDKLTPKSKAFAIKQIELEQTKLFLSQEVAANKIALEQKEAALKKGLATETEVSEAKKKLKLAELALLKNTTNQEQSYLQKLSNSLKQTWHNLTDFFKGIKKSSEETKAALNDAIAAAAENIKAAINNAKQAYFDNQRQEIEDRKESAINRLNIEQQQVENTAQSEAEKESIRRQFDAKRKAEEKKAAEEKKQLALKQAAVDFAIGVVKTLAAYPFPFSLIPVAGLTIAYLLQRSAIQKQKFAKGGVPTSTGGQITGPSHEQGGVPFEAEGGELAIINKRSANTKKVYNVTGTPLQIASAINQIGGGVNFSSGAYMKKYANGGYIGSIVQPPVFRSYYEDVTNAKNQQQSLKTMEELQSMINATATNVDKIGKQVYASDSKKVIVVERDITTTQKQSQKQNQVAVI